MSKIILCVTEGEKTEIQLLTHIQREFLPTEQIEFICFRTSIYQLYQKIINDDFFDFTGVHYDTFPILQEISLKDKSEDILSKYHRDNIAEIYLFFDLDAHDTLAKDNSNCFNEMLQLFNNETENGKLYISYPMVEAFKHPISDMNHPISKIELGSKYKTHVASICDKKLENYQHLSKNTISKYFLEHIKITNLLINGSFSYPIIYESEVQEKFTQDIIYQNQLRKFISPRNRVLVLSPFPLFLLEYLGKPLFDEWQAIS